MNHSTGSPDFISEQLVAGIWHTLVWPNNINNNVHALPGNSVTALVTKQDWKTTLIIVMSISNPLLQLAKIWAN